MLPSRSTLLLRPAQHCHWVQAKPKGQGFAFAFDAPSNLMQISAMLTCRHTRSLLVGCLCRGWMRRYCTRTQSHPFQYSSSIHRPMLEWSYSSLHCAAAVALLRMLMTKKGAWQIIGTCALIVVMDTRQASISGSTRVQVLLWSRQ